MIFVQNLTSPEFRPKILPHKFHQISKVLVIRTQKMSVSGEIYTVGTTFTLALGVTGGTNLISV